MQGRIANVPVCDGRFSGDRISKEVIMKVIALVLVIVSIMSFSLCWAQDASVEKAYALYYKGQKQEAIKMMEDYIKENPDPEAYYFLGYAYYEMKQMEKSAQYFNEAFRKSPFYSPVQKEKEAPAAKE